VITLGLHVQDQQHLKLLDIAGNAVREQLSPEASLASTYAIKGINSSGSGVLMISTLILYFRTKVNSIRPSNALLIRNLNLIGVLM
jgi:hypothetical protein